jgi:hypothetical protein
MARNISSKTQTRAIISENLSDTFAGVYTNNSGEGAELVSVNVNGTGDSTEIIEDTGASEWTYFGSNQIPVNQDSDDRNNGYGIPYPVKLDADRVLIFFLPHYQHFQGDNSDFLNGEVIHTQILEYESGRFRAGPINHHKLPTQVYNNTQYSLWSEPNSISDQYNQTNWRAIATSPTKVVAAYRQETDFQLLRFTITGNTVETSIETLDITGASYFASTTARAFDLARVPDAPDQVVVGGWADSNWSLQAFSVPDDGEITNLTSLTSTGISNSSYHFSLSEMVNEATSNITPYIIAGSTDSNSAQAVIFNYDSANYSLSVAGTAVALNDSNGSWAGLSCQCTSSDTSVSAVIATIGTSNTDTMTFYPQNSASTAFNSPTVELSLQHTSSKSIQESYRWGNERAVFAGDGQLLVVFDSNSVATNLHPENETTETERVHQQFYPFDSKPIYNQYDQSNQERDRVPQYYSRKNVESSTDVGDRDDTGTYLPMGFDRGMCYAWNENANCWIVGYHGRIYALDTDGAILGEKKLYDMYFNLDWQHRVGDLNCTPSGRILFHTLYRVGSYPNSTYRVNRRWDSMSAGNGYLMVSDRLHNGEQLGLIQPDHPDNNFQRFNSVVFTCNLTTFVDYNGTERAFCFGVGSNTVRGYFARWSEGETFDYFSGSNINTTDGSNDWFRGYHPNMKLIQNQPVSQTFPSGTWRLVGSYQWDSRQDTRRLGISNPQPENSFSSLDPDNNQITSEENDSGFGISLFKYTSGSRSSITVATVFDTEINRNRVWSSINGSLNFAFGWTPDITTSSNAFGQAAVTKFGYAVAFQKTTTADGSSPVYIFDNSDVESEYEVIDTDTGSGWVTLHAIDKNSYSVYGDNIDKIYSAGGIPDNVKLYMRLYDNSTKYFSILNGQDLELIRPDNSLYRSTEIYHIPPGYSLEARSDTPHTITTMLTIKEYI